MTNDPIRAALERLVSAYGSCQGQYEEIWPEYLDEPVAAARAALAESDGPAVPEGREPASVAGKSSDENCWQWYTYCPEEGLEMYSDRKQAQSAAQSVMGSYEVAAHSDGWHEDMELVSWGMLVPVEQAQVVERKTAEPDDEFDEWVKYGLRPVRWGHPAPQPPAEGEVAEVVAWLRENAEDERQMCESSNRASLNLERAAELIQQQEAKIEWLEQQLETEQMRVVACGIIATSDTPFSAAHNRNCHPDYWSASADDIVRQIDELMRLRAQQTPVPVCNALIKAANALPMPQGEVE